MFLYGRLYADREFWLCRCRLSLKGLNKSMIT